MNIDRIKSTTETLWYRARGKYKLPKCNFKIAQVNYATGAVVCNGASFVLLKTDQTPLGLVRVEKQRFDDMDVLLGEIIPHELAHLVCQMKPKLGHSYRHDDGWCDVYDFLKGVYYG